MTAIVNRCFMVVHSSSVLRAKQSQSVGSCGRRFLSSPILLHRVHPHLDLRFDGFDLEVIHLRRHTPGFVALLYRDPHGPAHLFTGDSLFPGGIGNTGGDANRFGSLYSDVVTRIFDKLPDDILVHPGHRAGTTLGAERGSLAEWKQRDW
jgi:glyoxylase-like metal-dependent hydrolase (beta-lactamase superfamily II)